MNLANAVIAFVGTGTGALLTWHWLTATRYGKTGGWVAFPIREDEPAKPRQGVLTRLWAAFVNPFINRAARIKDADQ